MVHIKNFFFASCSHDLMLYWLRNLRPKRKMLSSGDRILISLN